MIITVTMNPTIDKTAETDAITLGALNRLYNVFSDASGKGVNVSKMIAVLGGQSVATGFLGGNTGEYIESDLRGLNIKTDFVKVSEPTRTNLKIICKGYGITELNEPGPEITSDEIKALEQKLLEYADPEAIFVLSGSLPRGLEADTYKRVIRMLKARGAAVFLDADGEPFRLALQEKPDFIKPNRFEIMQYFGKEGETSLSELVSYCQKLISCGVNTVVLSMGADGALFVSPDEVLHSPGLRVMERSATGAGDAMTASFAYALERKSSLKDAAALAMAASAGTVTTPGTKPPSREVVDELLKQVTLNPIAHKQ